MNQLEIAIKNTVRDYKPGTNMLFALMEQTSRQRLLNKACETTMNAHFTPRELVNLQNITGDYRINDVMRSMEKRQPIVHNGITDSLIEITKELGAMAQKITESEADGVYTEREKADCIKQLQCLEKACSQLKQAIHQQQTGVSLIDLNKGAG